MSSEKDKGAPEEPSGEGSSKQNISGTCDWQLGKHDIKSRGQHLLETGLWADCHFLLGVPPNQEVIAGHKLILAMASPVFEAMFFGGLAEKADPIAICDVQPESFRALLEYIYTDTIRVNTVDKACGLVYAAKKYMLPYVVEQCTKFLWSDLQPSNVCRAYEFARLFEENQLMMTCLEMICTRTMEVIEDPSFEEVEMSTILTILDQEFLSVDSELSLYYALSRYSEKHAGQEGSASRAADIRQAVQKIRFLTLTPQQFAEGPGRSTLLSQNEAFVILMNISSPTNCGCPMPEGFSTSRTSRIQNVVVESPSPQNIEESPARILPASSPLVDEMHDVRNLMDTQRFYCIRSIRQQTDYLNTSVLDCSVTFSVNRCICITGVQVPTQVLGESNMQRYHDGSLPERYSELLYAHLLDSRGSRLTYTHCTSKVRFDCMLEISFDRPVFIQRYKRYKIGIVFNKVGWYPMAECLPTKVCQDVTFSFGVGMPNESVRDGLIRAIVFAFTREGI
ncbi:BTB/POZ domain-containing protein 6-B-like [Lutzomyia longipalpis]|uniref:BTB/POZ domain-containing protein 6-B-like n=1 Tax=Lutzomyia longipalpis TaxID=7200 RepID=UPI00248405FA|nr:BTB/POZ domain-containing protein 6-B-like [Lutzomyia longipalpis]